MLHTLFSDWSPLAVFTKLLWLAQLGMIVHALRTGRPYWWIWILLMAPGIGALAYALVELLPNLRVNGPTVNWKPRSWRICELRAQLEESDTVKLRLALADELLAAQRPDEACAVAAECLHGVFRDDPHTLAAVARYRLEAGQTAEALAALDRVKVEADRMLATNVAVLRGRALVEVGRHAEAQPALRSVEGSFIGDEAHYFLAVSLHQTGAVAEARELWLDIQRRYRRATPGWRRAERRWFKLSGERLAEPEA